MASPRAHAPVRDRRALALAALVLAGSVAGCATVRRALWLPIDHHVGMMRAVADLVTGEAVARDERVAKLRAELEASREEIGRESEPRRRVALLEHQVALLEALVGELEHAPGHGHSHGQP